MANPLQPAAQPGAPTITNPLGGMQPGGMAGGATGGMQPNPRIQAGPMQRPNFPNQPQPAPMGIPHGQPQPMNMAAPVQPGGMTAGGAGPGGATGSGMAGGGTAQPMGNSTVRAGGAQPMGAQSMGAQPMNMGIQAGSHPSVPIHVNHTFQPMHAAQPGSSFGGGTGGKGGGMQPHPQGNPGNMAFAAPSSAGNAMPGANPQLMYQQNPSFGGSGTF